MLWFKHPEIRESPEEAGIKSVLAGQGYEVAKLADAAGACRTISDYMSVAVTGSP